MSSAIPPKVIGDAVEPISRRALLWSAVAAVAALVCGDKAGEWIGQHHGRTPSVWEPFEVAGGAQLERGRAIAFDLPDGAGGALLIHADSGLRAFARSCPHLGCPVLWSEETQRIECPCHAAAFDADSGRVLSGPPPRGLTPLNVATRLGRVVVAPRSRTT